MTTVADIVRQALIKVGATDMGTSAAAEDAATGLAALNNMLAAWKLYGVDVSHTDLALADTFPLADEFREGTVYLLASRISPDFGLPQTFDADAFFRGIQAAYMTISTVTIPTPLSRMPSQYWPRFGIR